ncbi:wall-associated kinase 2 [Prunus dulcis]|uniref:Wall-associated kinase 2 n=1 Tax=Prunus dulcis TaxID=3755 RepID=A0A4Y1R4M7_PRUDU|nr:wall-associated kinase 2 [Prunus dulcis]
MDQISNSVIYTATAREVWDDLRERFSQKNAPRIFEIRRAIANHTQGYWDELSSYISLTSCTCGASQTSMNHIQEEHLMQFLAGLNESYFGVRSNMLLQDPLPTVNRAYSLLLQDERQRSLQPVITTSLDQSAMAANRPQSHKPFYHCKFCDTDGHSESRCRKNPASKNYMFCTFCDIAGHTQSHCKKKNGTAKTNSSSSHTTSTGSFVAATTSTPAAPTLTHAQYNQLIAMLPSGNPLCFHSSFNLSSWIIDSGATDHMDLSSKREIGKGLERGGLYYLAPDVPSIANSAVASPSFNLWHWRLEFEPSDHATASAPTPPLNPITKTTPPPSPITTHSSPISHTSSLPPIPSSSPPSIPTPSDSTPLPPRHRKPPGYLSDYHCYQSQVDLPSSTPVQHGTRYPLSHYLSYDKFSIKHQSFLASITTIVEPNTFDEAIKYPEWRKAMQSELAALEANHTWTLMALPAHKKAIGCKWVYKIKRHSNGTIQITLWIKASFSVLITPFFYRHKGTDTATISIIKNLLHQRFHLKDLGDLKYFLGIEVSRSPKGLYLSQRKYALDILKDLGLIGARPTFFPMEQNLKLNNEDGELLHNPETYRRLVGRLIYLTITRPDIVHTVHILSQFMQSPRTTHKDAADRLLHYLKGTPGQGILLSSSNNFQLRAYCDSNWASCPMTRRSTTGYFVLLGESPISWKTKKQDTVSRS